MALNCLGEEEARALAEGTIDWLDEMEANGYGVSQIPVVRAKAHALSGDGDQAVSFLESYAQHPGPILLVILNDPAFRSIEDDPRFLAVVATIRAMNRAMVEAINQAIEKSGLVF